MGRGVADGSGWWDAWGQKSGRVRGQGGCLAGHGQYLQAVQEELHAIEIEEHLAVVGRLVRDVPQGTPGELHHLVTLKGEVSSAQLAWRALQAPDTCEGAP